MNKDQISKIWIDKVNRLCIEPQTATFEQIYRSAMGVHWDVSEHFLYPITVGSWSPIEWFRQIISAVKSEYGYLLYITEKTMWENIDAPLKQLIEMENDICKSLNI